MTLGIAMGSFINENKEFLAIVIEHFIRTYLFTYPRAVLLWLDAWPAGLKLNAELSGFYVRLLSGVLDAWGSLILPRLPTLLPPLLQALSTLSSMGGLTLLLSLLSDLLVLPLTLHLRASYELTRTVYAYAGVSVGGGLLGGVFRGKRKNVLRGRTDAYGYDMDQLLFGTVMFTLIAFLVPTAAVYYVFFAVIRLIILLVQAALETLLALLHHFPLFAIMLRVKDRGRLSGGVYFCVHPPRRVHLGPNKRDAKHEVGGGADVPGYMSLESQPISVSEIFVQYSTSPFLLLLVFLPSFLPSSDTQANTNKNITPSNT
ncbi:Gpi1-domain-containing protein [Agrocybe pediades]|nr:Gpi1-domain-containing protein [Agrocybe pediades]